MFEHDTLTYRELDRRADTLAHELQARGVGPEVIVGLFVERSLEMVVGLLGVLKSGGAYLPIDPSSPTERVALMLEDAGVTLLLTQGSLRARAPEAFTRILALDTFDWTRSQRPAPRARPVHPNPLAYVIYTSGSTGRPKGVCIDHDNIVAYTVAISQRLELTPGLRYATVSTGAADLGYTAVFPSLTTGGCLHVISRQRADSPAALEEYFRRTQIDVLKIAPSHLAALHTGRHPEHVMPRRRLILGGEVSRLDWIDQLRALAPPDCEIFNHYGPTETTVGVLTYRVPWTALPVATRTLPLGMPLPHARVYVLDAHGAEVPAGMEGELWIGGRGVGRGYLNRPELTAERFVPDPFADDPGGRMYRTGDLARRQSDGTVEFRGRLDDQVKIRGNRVEPGEIEGALCRHDAVSSACVVAMDDGVSGQRLVAYAVPSRGRGAPSGSDAPLTPAVLRAHLTTTLPPYMIPSAFVLLDALPLTANGKVDRQALPAPAGTQSGTPSEPSRPLTATETTLAGIWTTMLNVDRVDADDNFFELGGHSLLAFRTMARIRDAFGIEVPLRALFGGPTLAGLAEIIDGLIWIAAPDPVNLTTAQEEITL